ncbi:hypothetical protein ACFLT7_00525 [candidate division KSB1 bacterium]
MIKNNGEFTRLGAPTSRRNFLKTAGMVSVLASVSSCAKKEPEYAEAARELGFLLADLHVHIDDQLTVRGALKLSSRRGVKFGLVVHAGAEGLKDDPALLAYIESLKKHPVFIGIQAEGPDWTKNFSEQAIAQLDFVLTDALKFPRADGTIMRLWQPDEVKIPDKQAFMDRYVDYHVDILSHQPIDIIANPTYLPEVLVPEYDDLWTEARMERIIDSAVENDVALEINARYRVPSADFVRLALAKGAKFSFGSNYHGEEVGKLDYCIYTAFGCGLEKKDIFIPGQG